MNLRNSFRCKNTFFSSSLFCSIAVNVLCMFAFPQTSAASQLHWTLKYLSGNPIFGCAGKCGSTTSITSAKIILRQQKAIDNCGKNDTLRSSSILKKDSTSVIPKNRVPGQDSLPARYYPGYNYLLPGAETLRLLDAPSLPYY